MLPEPRMLHRVASSLRLDADRRPLLAPCLGIVLAGLPGCGPTELNLEVSGDLPCGDELDECDGQCIDVGFDVDNCGECGRACGSDQVCWKGSCNNTCDAGCSPTTQSCMMDFCDCRQGLNACGDRCVDLQRDPENCGVCGRTCGANQLCERWSCVDAACETEPEVCAGSCTNIDDDILNCGGCGIECASDEVCILSECVPYFNIAPDRCASCPCDECDQAGQLCCQLEFLDGQVLCVEGSTCG